MAGLIDVITNLAGLLLWLIRRSLAIDPLSKAPAATLVGTLKRAEPRRLKAWHLLIGLAALLGLRALVYWLTGSGANWVARLDLMVVVLPFRTDHFPSALLFSVVSFGRTLLLFYVWLLALIVINYHVSEPDPIQKILRLHLGRFAHWPRPVLVVLPLLLTTGLWMLMHPLLVRADVMTKGHSVVQIFEQGLLVGAELYCSLKYLLPALLLVYLVATYVYLGSNPLWDFISSTARNLLAPLDSLPLRVGKCDFAPLVGAVVLLLLLHWLPGFVLSELAGRRVAIWPQ